MKTKPPRHIALPLYAETLPAVCSLAPVSERAEGQTSISPDPQKKTFPHNISLLFTLIRFACFFCLGSYINSLAVWMCCCSCSPPVRVSVPVGMNVWRVQTERYHLKKYII